MLSAIISLVFIVNNSAGIYQLCTLPAFIVYVTKQNTRENNVLAFTSVDHLQLVVQTPRILQRNQIFHDFV